MKVKCQNPLCPKPDVLIEWNRGRRRKYHSECRIQAYRLRKAKEEQEKREQQQIQIYTRLAVIYCPGAVNHLMVLYEENGYEAAQRAIWAMEEEYQSRSELKSAFRGKDNHDYS